MANNLPDFERPPINEVAIGVQFDPIPAFQAVHFGAFWERIRGRYPFTEDMPPLPVSSSDGAIPTPIPNIMLQLRQGNSLPRVWYLTDDKRQLVQLQQGRFIRNWRKLEEGDVYPRYGFLWAEFQREWHEFLRFARESGLGEANINHCELTYIDHVDDVNPEKVGNLSSLLSYLNIPKGDFLPDPVESFFNLGYQLPGTSGRLRVEICPAFRARDLRTILSMTFTAQGPPGNSSAEAVAQWFDVAHEWINRTFDEITDPKMHEAWRRKS